MSKMSASTPLPVRTLPGKVGSATQISISALLFESEKQNALLFIDAAAVCTEDSTKEKKNSRTVQPSSLLFFCCCTPEHSGNRLQEHFPANAFTLEKFLSAQMPRTKTSLLLVKTIFLSTKSLLSHDLSDRKEKAARPRGRFQRLFGLMYTHFLPQRKTVSLGKKTEPFCRQLMPTLAS